MSNTFHLVIASVGESRYDAQAQSATFPGTAGEFTVLANHEAIVTTLKPGFITVKDAEGETKKFEIESGVLECSGNRAVALL